MSRGPRPPASSGRPRAPVAPRRAGCAGSQRRPPGRSSRDRERRSSGVRKPRGPEHGRVREPQRGAAQQPDRALGRQQQLAGGDQRRRGADDQRQPPPLVGDREEPLRERVHEHEHDQVGGDEREPGADDAERGDERRLSPMLAAGGGDRGGEVVLGAPRASEHDDLHEVQRVQRHPRREQADRLVGVEELGRREQAHDPARQQPHADDRERAHRHEPGDDQRVRAPRLVVVADRVGERRPRELEPPHEHVDRLRELDRQRVQPRLGEPGEAHDDDPVDEVERVQRQLRRHRREPEADHAAQQRPVGDQRQSVALVITSHATIGTVGEP